MTVELYEAPMSDSSDTIDSPISNTTGELPDQEPELNLGNLLGSFDSQEAALAFVQDRFQTQNQQITDSRVAPFDDYTHVSGLTVTVQHEDGPIQQRTYYLVTDEGY